MRPKRSPWWLGIALSAALTWVFVEPAAQAQTGGTLVIGLDQEPPTLDPHASPSAVTYQIIASVTENLIYRGPDGKLVPWLAESWQSARDGRSVTFKLRRDVKFHDGTAFNAEAVKFNFDRIVDPKFKAGGARALLAGYAGSKVIDEHTVQVSFESPYAPFLAYTAAGPLSFVSPKAVRETGDQVHTRPVGSGPFMVKDYVAKDHTTMVRNPAYTRKAPWSDRAGGAALDAVVWKAFAPLTAAMLDDPTLRQAYPFDPAKAQALLAEAGWQPGGDGIRTRGSQRLEVVLNAIEYGGGPEPSAQLIQSSLREVGIDVKIKAQARPPWYEDNYRCATHGPVMFLRATDPDGLYALFHSSLVGGNFNWSCVKNAKLDQLLEQGRREFDPAKRRAIYLTIEQMALDEALTVPLVDELSVWAFRAAVRGVKYNFATYPVLSDAAIR